MIKDYEQLLSEMDAPELEKDKEDVIRMLDNLRSQKADYEAKVNPMGEKVRFGDDYDVRDYYGFDDSVINDAEKKKSAKVDSKMEETDKRLRDKYSTLEDQKQELASSRSKFKKVIAKKKVDRTKAKIEKLQAKQGMLGTTQKMIINANTNRYIEKVEEKNRKLMKEHERKSEFTHTIKEMNEERDSLSNEISDVEKDIADIKGTKLKDKIEKMQLKSNKRRLESELKRLKNKEGRVILANQIRESVSRYGI